MPPGSRRWAWEPRWRPADDPAREAGRARRIEPAGGPIEARNPRLTIPGPGPGERVSQGVRVRQRTGLEADGAPDRRGRIRVRGAVRAPLVDLHKPWRHQFEAAEEAGYFISAAGRHGLSGAEALVESLLHLSHALGQDVARRMRQG